MRKWNPSKSQFKSEEDYIEWTRERNRSYQRKWREEFSERKRFVLRQAREKRFGVTYPTWWLCDVCSKPISLSKGEIQLDHDHTKPDKEAFRGWLCSGCNPLVERVVANASRIFDYLRKERFKYPSGVSTSWR